jgi:hypothetical protein
MIGFPKTYFRWREPRHTSKRATAFLRIRLFKLLGTAVTSSALFLLLLGQFHPIPILRAFGALALIVIFILIVYTVYANVPPYVVVTSSHVYRGLDNETADVWQYKNISHCEFSCKVIDGNVFNAMNIVTSRGENSLILIPLTVSVNALRSFLVEKGVQAQDGPTRRCS